MHNDLRAGPGKRSANQTPKVFCATGNDGDLSRKFLLWHDDLLLKFRYRERRQNVLKKSPGLEESSGVNDKIKYTTLRAVPGGTCPWEHRTHPHS